MRAAAYARVSTLLNQDPELQLSHLRNFSEARGFHLVKEFIDQGISGAKERRPALDSMIQDARHGKFKIIVVAGIDRLARDTRHLLNLIAELNHYGVSIISLRENIDFSTPLGQATLTILGAVAQLERELIRERIKNALAAKKLAAKQSGSGWRCGRPALDKSVVLQVQDLRKHGKSIRAIAKELGIGKTSAERILRGYR